MADYDEIERAFDTVRDLEPEEVGARLGGKVEANFVSGIFENACAIRLSHAFNEVSKTNQNIPSVDFVRGQTVSGASGDWYIYRVGEMQNFMRDYTGNPDIVIDLNDYNLSTALYQETIAQIAIAAGEHGIKLPEYIVLANDIATGALPEEALEGYQMPSMIEQVSEWLQIMEELDARVDVPGLENVQGYFQAVQELKDYKGVIAFDSETMEDSLGHVDLWDGDDCRDTCRIDDANKISVWKIEP